MARKLVDSLATRKLLAEHIAKNATVMLECEPEETRIEGNASAVDPDTDRETNEWIRRELRSGNEWAWCRVVVTITYDGFEARDSLGCCSYESEAAFKAPGGYFDDMVRECASDIVARLFAARDTLARVWELASNTEGV